MKHWIIATILLATIMLGGYGCMEAEKETKTVVDIQARQQIVRHYGQIKRNYNAIRELQRRGKTNYKESQGIQVKPVPVPIIPVPDINVPPRLPPTRINESKKFTLLWPVPMPEPLPNPEGPVPTYRIHLL